MGTNAEYLNKTLYDNDNAIAITGGAATYTLFDYSAIGDGSVAIKLIVLSVAQLKTATLTFYLQKNGIPLPSVTITSISDISLLNLSYRNFCNADGVGNYYLPLTDKDKLELVVTSVDAAHNAVCHWAALTKN